MNISTNSSNALSSLAGKPRRKKFGPLSFIFLLLMGLVFTGVGWLVVGKEVTSVKWPTVEGRVSDVSISRNSDGASYTPTVTYVVDGKTYTVSQSFGTSSVETVGATKTIAYEPGNPSNGVIRTTGMNMIVYLFPLAGICVIIGSIVGLVFSIRRGKSIQQLTSTGQKITGIITGVKSGQNSSTKIIVSATDPSGSVKEYVSDSLAGNVFGALDFQSNPIPVDVYVSMSNPEQYYVDISDIPQLTPDKVVALLGKAGNGAAIQPDPTLSQPTVPSQNINPSQISQLPPQPPSRPTDTNNRY